VVTAVSAIDCKPMALLNLVYRDQLFPRPASKHAFNTTYLTLSACGDR
jgi:hypothetical protein